MPEEAFETQELKEKLEEAREQIEDDERRERGETPWTLWLSLTTAVIAVLAAIASLEAGAYANDAILRKDDAILHQSKADDAWAHYQAAGVKAVVYATQAETATRPELGSKLAGEAEHERAEQVTIKAEAESEQAEVAEMDEKAAHKLHVHHHFARSVTVFQVSIALAAIAALTRRKPMWWVSLAVGVTGAVFFVLGILAS
ncbi:MAG TPA: DUF4337 family protein [Polyangiaceae bacterium]|jgi:hypothetical protein|nr:DUF4337 family protein [Polyangiaceae bacterium]